MTTINGGRLEEVVGVVAGLAETVKDLVRVTKVNQANINKYFESPKVEGEPSDSETRMPFAKLKAELSFPVITGTYGENLKSCLEDFESLLVRANVTSDELKCEYLRYHVCKDAARYTTAHKTSHVRQRLQYSLRFYDH